MNMNSSVGEQEIGFNYSTTLDSQDSVFMVRHIYGTFI